MWADTPLCKVLVTALPLLPVAQMARGINMQLLNRKPLCEQLLFRWFGTAVTVTLTNEISNPTRKITFNYSLQAQPSANDWITAVTISPNGAAQQFTFPQGTQAISMVYEASSN